MMMQGTQPKDAYQVNPKESEVLKHSLMRSTQRIVLLWKILIFEYFWTLMIKFSFSVINDNARKKTQRPSPCRPIKIRDVETTLDAKHSAGSSGVEKIQVWVFLNEWINLGFPWPMMVQGTQRKGLYQVNPKKIKDFETLHDAKHSADSSGVENTQHWNFLN